LEVSLIAGLRFLEFSICWIQLVILLEFFFDLLGFLLDFLVIQQLIVLARCVYWWTSESCTARGRAAADG